MPVSKKPRKKDKPVLTDAQIKIDNAKAIVRSVFAMIEKHDQNTDNA